MYIPSPVTGNHEKRAQGKTEEKRVGLQTTYNYVICFIKTVVFWNPLDAASKVV